MRRLLQLGHATAAPLAGDQLDLLAGEQLLASGESAVLPLRVALNDLLDAV